MKHMLLASLNAYKVYNPNSRFSIIIDEISFMNVSDTGTINILVREGRQRKISLILASQDFEKEKLNAFIGNFSTKVFFKPTDCSIVSNYINSPEINNNFLNNLDVGECVVHGNLYDKFKNKNSHTVLYGKTADFVGSAYYPIETQEPIIEITEDKEETDAEENLEFSENQIPKNDILGKSENESVDTVEQDLLEPVKTTMKVHVLVEDKKDENEFDLECENGLSFYIEYMDKKILLDFGRTDIFINNAWYMKIDLEEIDFAVLSHAYIDHSGGLEKYRYDKPKFPIYARNEIREKYYCKKEKQKEISMSRYIRNKKDFFDYISESIEIEHGIYLVEHSSPKLSLIAKKNGLYKCKDYTDSYVPDDFMHEQTLVFDTLNGLVIFNSCSNGGVSEIIHEVKHFIKGRPIYAYIGGFHIVNIEEDGTETKLLSDDEITKLCNFIKKENIAHIYTGHCTGEYGFKKLQEQLGEDVVKCLTTGMVFEL